MNLSPWRLLLSSKKALLISLDSSISKRPMKKRGNVRSECALRSVRVSLAEWEGPGKMEAALSEEVLEGFTSAGSLVHRKGRDTLLRTSKLRLTACAYVSFFLLSADRLLSRCLYDLRIFLPYIDNTPACSLHAFTGSRAPGSAACPFP